MEVDEGERVEPAWKKRKKEGGESTIQLEIKCEPVKQRHMDGWIRHVRYNMLCYAVLE